MEILFSREVQNSPDGREKDPEAASLNCPAYLCCFSVTVIKLMDDSEQNIFSFYIFSQISIIVNVISLV